MRKIIILILFSIMLFAKNVLIINSYSVRMPWTRGELNGILKKIGNREDLKIYIEFMDTKVFRPTPKRIKFFYNYLKNKYNGMKFNILIATDDNALNFIRKYKNTPMFKNAKVFFCGINNLSLANILNKNIYAGVFEKKEPLVNFRFLKEIIPGLTTIYIVADNSNSGKAVIKETKKAYKNIKGYKFVYIDDKHLEDVLKKIKNAPSHSGMLLLTPYSFYLQGQHIGYKYAVELISQNFPHPIVIHTDILADIKHSNIVGGKVTDSLTQGEVAGKKVLEYLDGKKMDTLGFTFQKANKMYLNVENLEKFGIDAYDLKFKNIIYVNKPHTFFELYKKWIVSFGLLLFAVIVISIILFLKNRQLMRYNEKISSINENLEHKIEEAIAEIKEKEELLSKYKEEAYKKIIRNIIFKFNYPIKELMKLSQKYEEEELKKLVSYMFEELNSFENFFLPKKREIIKVKEEIEKNVSLIRNYYEAFGIKLEIEGEDFEITADKKQFEQIISDILSKAKEIIKEKNINDVKIKLILNSKLKSILIKVVTSQKISEFETFIKDSVKDNIVISKLILENCMNGIINYQNDKNSFIFEIKFIQ